MTIDLRLRAALAAPSPGESRDDLDPSEFGEVTPAAVLVPITRRARPGLILTVRHGDLRNHAGQVAFPGGRIDPGESPEEAALREAFEELAIRANDVDLLGTLDPYLTGTGFAVTPWVGLLPPDLPLVPAPGEVEDWFEAPLDRLLDPAHHHRESTMWKGRMRNYWRIDYEGRNIWGATAGMIVGLSRRMAA
ncbi:CoA pyrophosphatase [Sphingomicrobium nitratireducens]|uniref:CoA pyrophosphatase n=1 Tax=Sphingomicrobium nitratireducens TaxID=2964666 RepID=UPI00223FB3D7|nr:CoA pyrophosphatase [Sphingomicrobium nitratireducens]